MHQHCVEHPLVARLGDTWLTVISYGMYDISARKTKLYHGLLIFLLHILPGVQVTIGLRFFLYSTSLGVCVDCDSLLYRLNLLVAP